MRQHGWQDASITAPSMKVLQKLIYAADRTVATGSHFRLQTRARLHRENCRYQQLLRG